MPNNSLLMLALVLKAYDLDQEAAAVMEVAHAHGLDALDLPGGLVVGMLNDLGLRCILYVAGRGPIPEMLHDAAETDHLVLVGLQPGGAVDHPHWGVLEKRSDSDIHIIEIGDDPSPVHRHRRIADVVTGEYIICQDRCRRIGTLRTTSAVGI